MPFDWTLIGLILTVAAVLGVITAVRAVLTVRTPQGAVAWIGALLSVPILSVPLYWVFGRTRFKGYVDARRDAEASLVEFIGEVTPIVSPYVVEAPPHFGAARVLPALTHLPFTRGNDTRVLVDGDATFEEAFRVIDEAEDYVITQFFIVNDDRLGREFLDHLARKVASGCRVYLLYDEVGSKRMTRRYLHDLRDAGVRASGIRTTRGGIQNRFQLNFRNHRKVVSADGDVAVIGGLNVGDEYVHRHPRLTPWRDTAIRVEGPEVLAVQLAFVEDWHWATGSVPELDWRTHESPDADRVVFVLPSGPSDEFETCELFFQHAINTAKDRVWIATPYFVPDEGTIGALELAALRGVDVRVLIPGMADKPFIKLAAMSYVEEMARAGVRIFEYQEGFMHQKVMLIDDEVSSIGTANFDNRSFRLNFELSVITVDGPFAGEVEQMLEADLARSLPLTGEDVAARPFTFHAASRFARLFAPVM